MPVVEELQEQEKDDDIDNPADEFIVVIPATRIMRMPSIYGLQSDGSYLHALPMRFWPVLSA